MKDNFWKAVVEIWPANGCKFFEYKYCIAPYDKGNANSNIKWEEG